VPLADPRTAPDLIKIAAAIAHGLNYELECVHVVSVPRSVAPAEAKVDLQGVEPLRRLAMSYAENSGLSVHFQVRAAHEIGRTLLEIIKKRHIDLVLMGWHHPTLTPGRVISGVVDTLIRQAPCQVVVVRPGRNLTFDRWLIPTAGGPNAQSAQKLLPGLLTLGHAPEIQLCTICHPEKGECLTPQHLSEMADGLEEALHRPVYTQVLTHPSVSEAVIDMARLCRTDAILLGASRENLLSQVIKGNVPLEIAQQTDITIILLRQVAE
jgi:CIC family chloride channel protein